MFNWTFLNVVGIVGGGVECFRAIFVVFFFVWNFDCCYAGCRCCTVLGCTKEESVYFCVRSLRW